MYLHPITWIFVIGLCAALYVVSRSRMAVRAAAQNLSPDELKIYREEFARAERPADMAPRFVAMAEAQSTARRNFMRAITLLLAAIFSHIFFGTV